MLKERLISGTLIVLLVIGLFFLNKVLLYSVMAIVAIFGIEEIWMIVRFRNSTKIDFALFFILPVIYLIFSLVFIAGELRWKCNIYWLISAIVGASTYDTFAYCFGKKFGKHKIALQISPNKTWEGTISGFLGPAIVSTITGKYFLSLSWAQIIALFLTIGILSFFGDLSVSWYKRKMNIKDMGNIIPGHGGILDRIDSHLLVLIGVYCFKIVS